MTDPIFSSEPRQREGFSEDRERKKWNAFWHEMPNWVKTGFVAITATGVTGGGITFFGGHKDDKSDTRLSILETKFDAMRDDQKEMKQDLKELLRRRESDYTRSSRGSK